jgi:DNA invertase Pin-like site-specific DNA recombinase
VNHVRAGAVRVWEPRRGSSGSDKLCRYSPDTLQRLIKDVEDGVADFQAIFVYGVSRWGRFQDVDASACYD